MSAAELLAFAERVEALDGPCRETDALIWHDVLGHCRHANTKRSGYQDDTGFDCLDCGADSWGNKSKAPFPVGDRLYDRAPAFTASLDAAMTLVPEGWSYQISANPTGAYATVVHKDHEDQYDERIYKGHASTPALALTAAALHARAAMMETNDG